MWFLDGAAIWIVLAITLGVLSIRKGHWVMFIIGIFLPIFWLIGAIMPPAARGSRTGQADAPTTTGAEIRDGRPFPRALVALDHAEVRAAGREPLDRDRRGPRALPYSAAGNAAVGRQAQHAELRDRRAVGGAGGEPHRHGSPRRGGRARRHDDRVRRAGRADDRRPARVRRTAGAERVARGHGARVPLSVGQTLDGDG